MPFVLHSTCGSLAYLKSYGFRTFDSLWDESYDTVQDDRQRIRAIADLLTDLDRLSLQQRQELYQKSQAICQHNYEHFYSGAFEQILWKELCDMLAEF
jgi:hypothetical protein